MPRPPKATLESVLRAMDELERRKEKANAENVQRITGGSMATVAPLLRQAKEMRETASGPAANGLGASCTAAIFSEISRHVDFALTAQREALESARNEADALIEEAKSALERVESLEAGLDNARSQAEKQRIEADLQLAATAERTAAVEERLKQVEGDRDNAIRAAEFSRTEAAKALLQVERADKAAAQAEERVVALEGQLESFRQERAEALQRAAVAEERATGADAARADSREQIVAMQRQLEAAIAENKVLSAKLLDLHVAKGEAEQRAARAETRLEAGVSGNTKMTHFGK